MGTGVLVERNALRYLLSQVCNTISILYWHAQELVNYYYSSITNENTTRNENTIVSKITTTTTTTTTTNY